MAIQVEAAIRQELFPRAKAEKGGKMEDWWICLDLPNLEDAEKQELCAEIVSQIVALARKGICVDVDQGFIPDEDTVSSSESN